MFGRFDKKRPVFFSVVFFFSLVKGGGDKQKFPSLFRSRFRSFEMCALRFFGFEDKKLPAGRNQVSVEGRERKRDKIREKRERKKSEEKGS